MSLLDQNSAALLRQLGIDPGMVDGLLSGTILLTVVTLLAAIPTGMIARRKRRSRGLWLLFALSVPLLPLLLVWLLPARPPADREGARN